MSNEFRLEIRQPENDDKYKIKYVYFKSDVDRDVYIRDEFNYCKVEEKAYLSALYYNQRINAVRDLYNKRIEFTTDKFNSNDIYALGVA